MPKFITQLSITGQDFILLFFKIQSHFQFTKDWHQQFQISNLVLKYNCLLFFICKNNPNLNKCLVRCKHCNIYFLTYFCNAGRDDLGCPFGCQEAHRKQQSNIRSADYYRNHKCKKKDLNDRRKNNSFSQTKKITNPKPINKIVPIFYYLHYFISIIERRIIPFHEILYLIIQIIRKAMRQHSLDFHQTTVYNNKSRYSFFLYDNILGRFSEKSYLRVNKC